MQSLESAARHSSFDWSDNLALCHSGVLLSKLVPGFILPWKGQICWSTKAFLHCHLQNTHFQWPCYANLWKPHFLASKLPTAAEAMQPLSQQIWGWVLARQDRHAHVSHTVLSVPHSQKPSLQAATKNNWSWVTLGFFWVTILKMWLKFCMALPAGQGTVLLCSALVWPHLQYCVNFEQCNKRT